MARTLDDSRRWMQQGTVLAITAAETLDEDSFSLPTSLPGWSRRNLVAHLSANAVAVSNLVHWAATGQPTPMYSSAEQRSAGISAGDQMSAPALVDSLSRSANRLAAAMDALTEAQWANEVVTAQGRTVPAAETPWMRAREVMVHAVDLDTGTGFADLPTDFLVALCDDIVRLRTGTGSGPGLVLSSDLGHGWRVQGIGEPAYIAGSLPQVAGYLTGRDVENVRSVDGSPAPVLPAWL